MISHAMLTALIRKHYKEIFDKLLLRVWKVLKAQLDAAALKNRPVKVTVKMEAA